MDTTKYKINKYNYKLEHDSENKKNEYIKKLNYYKLKNTNNISLYENIINMRNMDFINENTTNQKILNKLKKNLDYIIENIVVKKEYTNTFQNYIYDIIHYIRDLEENIKNISNVDNLYGLRQIITNIETILNKKIKYIKFGEFIKNYSNLSKYYFDKINDKIEKTNMCIEEDKSETCQKMKTILGKIYNVNS